MLDRKVSRRDALKITAVTGVSVAFGGALTRDVLRQLRLRRVSETRSAMGTVVTLTVVHPDGVAAQAMVDASFEEMARLESILSRHRADTPVGRLNATGRLHAPPVELIEVLRRAEQCSLRSGGAFDVTVAPLLALYERVFAGAGAPPIDREIDAVTRLVDYRGLRFSDRAVTLDDPRMAITLDGIAKGYIVDRTIDVLSGGGAERVIVNAGGDMATGGGTVSSDPWTIGIQDPHDPGEVVGLVRLGGECIATSGDYMRSFTEDRRFHHIIDPRTGRSPAVVSSVSVVAASAMDADALSTATLVLGPVAGMEFLEAARGVEGVIVGKSGERHTTSGLQRHTV